MSTTTFPEPAVARHLDADRLGVIASVLCAIHCAITPLLLFILPSFGRVWAHPASHWGMALLVIPVAATMVLRGFRYHRRKWVVGCGSIGISLIIAGAVLPYLESRADAPSSISFPLPRLAYSEAASCADSCCPSTTRVSGKHILHIPPASIVTTLGGIALIITHLGNLCARRACCESNNECDLT